MQLLIKAVYGMMAGFLLAIISGILFIPFLKKVHANQSLSIYLRDTHAKKAGTPTMGGILFIAPTLLIIVLLLLFHKITMTYSLMIVLFTFASYALIGFIDDYLIIKKHNNKGLSERDKMLMQLVVAIIFFFLFMLAGNEPLLWIHTLHFKLNIGFFYGLFILFVLVASSNAVNITDGLDGLAAGLSAIAFFTFGIIGFATGWLEGYESIGLFSFILTGTLLGFLFFNVSPAKIFMGDTGSLSLGATLGAIAILTRHEILLILIGIVFVIETASCVIQRFYFKLTRKRIFPMTPIHHSFEKAGFQERDIVRIFWVIGLVASFLAIIYGVII